MYFIFNGINSNDIGLKIKDFPFDTMASKKLTELSIDKRNGTIYKDYNTFNSYTMDIECTLLDNFNIATIKKIKDVFKVGEGELILSHKPDNIYRVRLINSLNFVEMLNLTGSCILSFNVEPFSYLKSGREYVVVSSGGILKNLGNYYSEPQIKVTGMGDITITINNKVMSFFNVAKPFIIDTYLEDIVGLSGENLNSYMRIESDFVPLEEGNNVIKYSGATSVEVRPNWREL